MWYFCTLQKGLKLAIFSPPPIYLWPGAWPFTGPKLQNEVV